MANSVWATVRLRGFLRQRRAADAGSLASPRLGACSVDPVAADRGGAVLTASLHEQVPPGQIWRALVRLEGYRPRHHDVAILDRRARRGFESVLPAQSLALIESWAIDPDFDGEAFRARWRGNRIRFPSSGDALVELTAFLECGVVDRSRRIGIRAVDVFGRISEAILTAGRPPR